MHLGAQVSMLGVQRLLSRLEKNGRGLLPTLRSVLFRRDDLISAPSRELAQQGLSDALVAARRAADDVFTRLARRLDGEPGPAPVLRLRDEFLADAVWDEGLGVALDNLLLGFSRLSEGAAMIADRLALDDPSERRAQVTAELHGVVRRLDAAAAGLTATLRPPASGRAAVRWLERRGRKSPYGSLAAVARVLLELAHASDGGMFVLFTSHAALRRAADAVRDAIGGRWPLFVQGEGQRDHLLRRFREAGSGILLGTDSFWEGVDVPGRALRVLILAKLPFKVPTEPLTAARLERLEARGLNGFAHYLVPNAALKLKQGFGRLIRSRVDVGAVVLLDRRVVTKRYGAMILDGLPPATRVVGDWGDVLGACEDFFARHGLGEEARAVEEGRGR